MPKRKKLTLKKRKHQFKTAVNYYRQKEKTRRKKEAEELNKLFVSYDLTDKPE